MYTTVATRVEIYPFFGRFSFFCFVVKGYLFFFFFAYLYFVQFLMQISVFTSCYVIFFCSSRNLVKSILLVQNSV